MSNLPAPQLQHTIYSWPSQEDERFGVDLKTKQGPSADDWERFRPIIKGLYVDEDLALVEVIKILADEHGHKAS
jgi:Clr5 domain